MSKKLLTKEEVLERIDSYDIFVRYIGHEVRLNTTVKSPLREEKQASFSLFRHKNGQVYFKDFAGDSGSCFDFVSILFDISFVQSVNKIIYDFQLGESTIDFDLPRITPQKIIKKVPERAKAIFMPLIKEYTYTELQWWKKFKISKRTLNDYKVYSLKSLCMARDGEKDFIINSFNDNPLYMYVYSSGRFKFYRPLAKDKKYKFLSNTNNSDIFGLSHLDKFKTLAGDKLHVTVICAGQKDVMSLWNSFGIRGISLQSESCLLSQELYDKLHNLAEHIFVCYDNDETGKKNAQKMNEEYGLPILDISSFTDANDIAEFFSMEGDYRELHNQIFAQIKRQSKFVL